VLRRLALALLAIPCAASAQWTYATSGTSAELRGLSAASEHVVWASGSGGTVLRSTDGGRTWTVDTVPGATHLDFRAIHAHDERTAVIVSAGEAEKGLARIFATGDAGRGWDLVYATDIAGAFLDAIAFRDRRRGVTLGDPVGGRFFLLESADAGRTWTRADTLMPAILPGEAAFAASGSSLVLHGDHAWIGTGGGGRARVLRRSGAGAWEVVESPVHAVGPASGIFSIATFDGSRLVVAGGDYTQPRLAAVSVALSDDGGRTWRAAKAPPAAYLSGIAYAGDASRLVAVGLAGTFVSRDGGDSWVHTDTVPLNAVRFVGGRGFAVGPRGRVAYMVRLP